MKLEKEQILEFLKINNKITSQDLVLLFGVSRQTAHKKLMDLVETGELIKLGKTRAVSYRLPKALGEMNEGVVVKLDNIQLKEHEVLEDLFYRFPALRSLGENLQSIFRYAFSEMLNNAIEHSQSDRIEVRVDVVDGLLHFEVRDFGIGVFRNIQKKFQLDSETDAITEVLKGKMTTAPKAHSGEGIFFTSKIADSFRLESYGNELLVANTIPDVFIRTQQKEKKGTLVHFAIATTTKKHLIDIFREYESSDGEHDFDTTKIQVKLYLYGTIHVSRSQARRILAYIPERFTRVVLDFDQVPTIGQAFADEVFRVFKTQHPNIMIETLNTNEAVQFMIDRVR